MIKQKQFAFTLVELLVVIAIIGILSGLIIVGMNSSVNNARIAKAQIFSASLRNSLLADLVSEWKFDNSSSVGADTWSTNNCTLNNGAASQTSGCVYGTCLALDGVDDYLSCGNANNLNITGSVTVGAWVKSTKNNAALFQGIMGKANLSGSELGYSLIKGIDNKFYFGVYTGTYMRQDLSTHSDVAYTDNDWHYLAGVILPNGSHYIYVDGVKQSFSWVASSWTAAASSIAFVIGTSYGDLPTNTTYLERFGGLIDEAKIYDVAMSVSEIEEQYYAGINKLLAFGEIDREKYVSVLGK